MRRITIVFAAVPLAVAGCGAETDRDKLIRAAEVRGECRHTAEALAEAVHRAAPFANRMAEIQEHAQWLFEEGPLSTHIGYRDVWFESRRTVHEVIEPAKVIHRELKDCILELDHDTPLTKEQAAGYRRLSSRGYELAVQIARAVHTRNLWMATRIEPALRKYKLPPPEKRFGLPPDPGAAGRP